MDIFGDKDIRRTEMIRVRNYSYAPYLEREGEFACPMPKPPDLESRKEWYTGLKPHERLFYHQTLSSQILKVTINYGYTQISIEFLDGIIENSSTSSSNNFRTTLLDDFLNWIFYLKQ
uniref:Uncharacterized protein n=1 Tax=Glossina pallidipes TaxID=7398 RepID=A0A1A9ZK83_GLOPL